MVISVSSALLFSHYSPYLMTSLQDRVIKLMHKSTKGGLFYSQLWNAPNSPNQSSDLNPTHHVLHLLKLRQMEKLIKQFPETSLRRRWPRYQPSLASPGCLLTSPSLRLKGIWVVNLALEHALTNMKKITYFLHCKMLRLASWTLIFTTNMVQH